MNWTDEQKAIIQHRDGHAKVSAVAGSGKSATLVERVASMLSEGVQPSRLQVVMFNGSASSSFNHRLRKRLRGTNINVPEVRTFHSIGLRLCESLSRYGHLPNWRFESQDWKESRLACDALMTVLDERPSTDEVESFLDFVGLVKSDIISADDKYPEATEITGYPMPAYFVEAYESFETLRAEAGVRFFSDLLHDPVMKLLGDEKLASKIGNRLDHLLVDEYQDINEIQQALITIIAGSTASVMVVGDADQCIYEWRGARPEYLEILFDADFPNPVNFQLSYTFRYGHKVSLLANHIISMNKRRHEMLCLSHSTTSNTEIRMAAETGDCKAEIEALNKWVDQGRCYSEVAILVRLYGMSVPLELAMLKARIPYLIDGRDGVFKRNEALMLLGYLRLAGGCLHLPSSDGSAPSDYVEAMLSQPSLGMTKKAQQSLAALLLQHPGEAVDVVESVISSESLPGWMARKMRARANLFDKAFRFGIDGQVRELMRSIQKALSLDESLLRESIREETGRDKIEVCHSLIDFLGDRTVAEALYELDELMGESATTIRDRQPNAVMITSIHKAKGLEWPFVIVPGLREGRIPAKHAEKEGPRLEAERRLCYVALTRAKEQLLLLHPDDTDLDWHVACGMQGPCPGGKPIASRFLYEANFQVSNEVGSALVGEWDQPVVAVDDSIARRYIERLGQEVEIKNVERPERIGGPICGPATPFRGEVDMRVEHVQFGAGVITEVIQRAGSFAVRVVFDKGGSRIMIAHQAILVEEASILQAG